MNQLTNMFDEFNFIFSNNIEDIYFCGEMMIDNSINTISDVS